MKKVYVYILSLFLSLSSFAQTWTPLTGPFGGEVWDIEKTATGKLYAATSFGGYSSTDGGATWARIGGITNYDVKDFEVNPTTGRIYAVCNGASNNYFYSDTNGVDWSSASIASLSAATRIEINPTNNQILYILGANRLFRSIDGGTSWTQNSFPFASTLTDIVISSGNVVMVASENNSVYRSLSGGSSWDATFKLTINASSTRNIRSLATYNAKFYALTTDNNIYRLDDPALVTNPWTSIVTASMTEPGYLYTGRITFNSTGILHLIVDNHLWTSSDPSVASPTWVSKGAIGAYGLQRIVVGDGNDLFVASSTHGVNKSSDSGTTWTLSTNGITSIDPTDILAIDQQIIVTDEHPGFYISTNGGQTWERNANPANNSLEYFRKIVDLGGSGVLLISGYGIQLFTGSSVLTNVGPSPGGWVPNYAFSKKAAGTVLIGGTGQNIYQSLDNGAGWSPVTYTGLPASFNIESLDMETLTNYASDQGYLYIKLYSYTDNQPRIYSVQNGTTAASHVTLPVGYQEIVDMQVLHILNGDVLYVLTRNGTTYTISYSSDHGTTWDTFSPAILNSSNARKIDVITDQTISYKKENVLNVYADGGKIFLSNDNGANWSLETYTAPLSRFRKMTFTDQNYAYLTGRGLQLHKSTKPLLLPAKPTNLAVSNFTFNRATLTWQDNSSLELVYTIEKSIGNNSNYVVETQALTNSTQTTFTNLLPNTTYFFRVNATSAGGKSPYSNEITFTTLDSNCALTIPDNRSWTSTLQRTRGPQFASLSPAIHTNPDQQYTLTFDATGTELEGAAKVYAHAGIVLVNAENPVAGDIAAPWEYVKGNWGADDGVGEMSPVSGQPNKWQLVMGPTLRNYFAAPAGSIYWLGVVFRNAAGNTVASNNGVSQDTFISIEKGSVATDAIISLTDQTNRRYSSTYAPNEFFESCATTTSVYGIGTGSWDALANTLLTREEVTDFPATGYVTVYDNTSVLNSTDPIPSTPVDLTAYVRSQNSNLLTWGKTSLATKYKIEREPVVPCPSDLSGTLISYVTTNMDAPDISASSPGPISGQVSITQVSPGVYTIDDYTFGMYTELYGGPPPTSTSFRWTHACSGLIVTGGAYGETTWNYTITGISAAQLTFNWITNWNDAGTTVLTRSDGKSWLQLTPPSNFQQIAEVNYPATRYVDSDPALVLGTEYAYRVAAINGAGTSAYSNIATATVTNTLFTPQESSALNKISYSGQGVVCVDLDNDGLDDLIMATFIDDFGESVSPLFFKNTGNGNFSPVEVPSLAIENVSYYRGILVADFNNDNLPDVFCSRADGLVDGSVLQDLLLMNNGNFQFTKTKVTTRPGSVSQFNSAVALDYNNDNFLDLFIVAGIGSSPHNFLWTNNGNGTFTQNTTAGNIVTDGFKSVEASTIDYDNDGDLDLVVGEYNQPDPSINRLYRNNSNGTFTRITGQLFDGVTGVTRWRSISVTDINNDGDLDLYMGGDAKKLLYKNTNGTFSDMISTTIVNAGFFGSTMGDIDNDGDVDIVTTAGRIYLNDGTGVYTEVTTPEAWRQNDNIGVGLADFDNDGFLDITGSPIGLLPLTIFKNNAIAGSTNKWIKIKLTGTQSNRSAIGARITVITTSPARTQIREVSSRTGYGSQNSLTQHFGLGTATTISSIVVRWPSGLIQTLPNVTANQSITIVEDNTGPVVDSFIPADASTGIVINTNLEITFDEKPVAVTSKKITITPILPAGTAQTINATTGTVSGNTVTLALGTPLNYLTQYSITIEAGAFKDIYGNPMNAFTTGWSFTSIDNIPPVISATESIALVAKGFGSTKFTAIASDNVNVTGVTLSYRGAGSAATFIELPGTLVAGKWEFTAQETFYNTTGLEFYFTAKDVDNNLTLEPVTGVKQSLFETTPPTLTILPSPATKNKGFGTITVSVTSTDNFGVASVVLSYKNTKDGVAFTNITGVADGTIANQYNFTVPESILNGAGIDYYFTSTDATGNSTRDPVAPVVYQFLLESTAPELIVPVHPTTINKGFATVAFSVSATDNFGVASVVLSYRNTKDGVTYTNLTGTLDGTVANQYNFSIAEAAFKGAGIEYYFTAYDATGNNTRKPVSPDVYQLLLESTPPVLTVPANSVLISKGFGARAFNVVATDNFGVSTVVISYRNTKDGVAYTDLTGTPDGSVANQYNFSVPESAFNGDGLEYYFTAADATGNTIRNPLITDSPSTFKMLLDNQAPSIVAFVPPASVLKANFTVTIKASDNIAVSSVVMNYRGIASKEFITSSPGNKNANGDYEFLVGSDWFDNMGIEYYFEAADASGNISTNPDITAATNKYHKTFLKFEGASLPKLDLIKGSTGASGFQIVSVPLELSNKNIADNFEELGTADKTAYRFLRYHQTPTPGWDEYPGGGLSVLARGEGYFLNSLKAEQITLLSGVAPQIDQANLFQMVLKKGWNQIGNPYTVQIQWSDVIAYNNNPAGVGKLVKYDNGYNTNDASGIIEPYKGGFVEVQNDITLKIPFKGFTSGGKIEKVDSDLGQQNWEFPFTLTQQGFSYRLGMIGMNKDASLTKDNFDLSVVPRLSEYIEASFDHPEYFTKYFAQDVVPAQDEYTWEFTVSSNLSGETVMHWDNTVFGENNKEMYLMDVNTQQLLNMRDRNSYSFDPKQSGVFKIFFGENLEKKIKPSQLTLGDAYPNPTTSATTISFSIPEHKVAVHVKLDVYDAMGKKMSSLVDANLLPGFYRTEWDAAALNLADGLFVYRLSISGDQGEEVLSKKIILKK